MSVEITTTFNNKYASNIAFLSQQMKPKFMDHVEHEDCYGSEGARIVNQIGEVNSVKKETRDTDTPIVNPPHDARWVYPSYYSLGILLDTDDKVRTITEPTSKHSRAIVASLNRDTDDEIIDAFFSNVAKTGKTGSTSTSWSAYVAASTAHHIDATSGMTVEALRAAREALESEDIIDFDTEELFVGIGPKQHRNLLSEIEATSMDFGREAVLVDGKITYFMGFRFVLSNRLQVDGSSRRRCPVWAKSGMALGKWIDVRGKLSERADKNHAVQAFGEMMCGATRTEEAKIVEIACTE